MGREIEKTTRRRVCLDTDVSIALIKQHPDALQFINSIAEDEIYLTAVTVFELLLRTSNLTPVEEFIKQFKILEFDHQSSINASQIVKSLKKGSNIEIRDLFIAAVVVSNNCVLATLNRKDFENIEGLKFVDF